jgi:hypothetical protein
MRVHLRNTFWHGSQVAATIKGGASFQPRLLLVQLRVLKLRVLVLLLVLVRVRVLVLVLVEVHVL